MGCSAKDGVPSTGTLVVMVHSQEHYGIPLMSICLPFSFRDVAPSSSREQGRCPGPCTRVTGLQHSTAIECFYLSKGKPSIPPVRLGVAGRELPRQGGDGCLCKPLNKVALSPRLTRSSLASSREFPNAGSLKASFMLRPGTRCRGAGRDQRDTGALLHAPDKRLPRGDTASKLSRHKGGDKGPSEEAVV